MLPSARPGLKLSVVIAAWNGPRALERCLRSLRPEACGRDTEVIVASNFDPGGMLADRFPAVRHVALPPATVVPMLRTAGIYASEGEIVALAEDHCTFDAGWPDAVKRAHDASHLVIGGAVENASVGRALDWAVYFYDYGKFMLPARAGAVESLPGNNVSYRRGILRLVEACFRDGFFEAFVHAEIQKRGYRLYLAPSAIVYHAKTYAAGPALAQSYHLARGYAAQRVLRLPRGRRVLLGLTAPLLPLLLTGRVVMQPLRRRRRLAEIFRSLPYLLPLLATWSAGECCGYLAGAGHSAGQWR